MKNQTKIVWTIAIIILMASCSKTVDEKKREQQLTSPTSTTADEATASFPHYYFTPWTKTRPAGVIKWLPDLNTANAIKAALEYDFNRAPTLSGAKQFVKWTSANQPTLSFNTNNSTGAIIDMEDPCGIEGTCGSTSGGDQTFIIEFTFYSDNFGPDYTGYIQVTYDPDTRTIEEVTFHVDATGNGIYGNLNSEMSTPSGYDDSKEWGTARAYSSDYPEPGSKYIVVDFHGTISTALGIPGLPQMFASSKMRFEIYGRVTLDPRNNVTSGTVTRKPY